MFGYVSIDKSNISDEQYAVYKSIYCSLCKTMGKEYSIFSRFILSYDCTFYALIIMSLKDQNPCFSNGHCSFNPTKKCSYIEDDISLSMAAAVSVTTAYYKLIDNIEDSNFFKSLGCRIILPIFRRWNNKAKVKYPEIENSVSKMSNTQFIVERKENVSLDNACDPTATMLSEICKVITKYVIVNIGKDNNTNERILGTFGYHLGRWIYLMDALDDYDKDKKNKSFNPLVNKFDNELDTEYVKRLLNHALSEMMLSYNLFNKSKYESIVNNILCCGLPAKQEQILNKYTK